MSSISWVEGSGMDENICCCEDVNEDIIVDFVTVMIEGGLGFAREDAIARAGVGFAGTGIGTGSGRRTGACAGATNDCALAAPAPARTPGRGGGGINVVFTVVDRGVAPFVVRRASACALADGGCAGSFTSVGLDACNESGEGEGDGENPDRAGARAGLAGVGIRSSVGGVQTPDISLST